MVSKREFRKKSGLIISHVTRSRPRLLGAAVVVIMHCMLITLEPQWTECEHNESAGSNCEDNTTFIFTLKEQRDASETEPCTLSGNPYGLMAKTTNSEILLHSTQSQYVNIKNYDMHAVLKWEGLKRAPFNQYAWCLSQLMHLSRACI